MLSVIGDQDRNRDRDRGRISSELVNWSEYPKIRQDVTVNGRHIRS